jgi:hypothetical protein
MRENSPETLEARQEAKPNDEDLMSRNRYRSEPGKLRRSLLGPFFFYPHVYRDGRFAWAQKRDAALDRR